MRVQPQKIAPESLQRVLEPKKTLTLTPTARRSLWLRRTAGAKRRGTNSQGEEAEEHPMPIEARSH
ncbi:hypothetical protein CBG25_00560 [Arsenophonus sp. ENCA]|uniref:hypothetical protein n=1 Tax=Arsenophonus sp. ENCA TaxID=1987579 RepID=UPI000BD6720A|nr:hypothetical protein [Arsenophonus sp. ENCA]PAV11380.1 hypothetical protein CBG25_00560 [Arsenophonus sp. ENCA]